MNPLAQFAPQCRRLLTEQQISGQGPGTILSDVQTLINFIGTSGFDTKSKQGNLPATVLPELNARLSEPLEVVLDRPLLKDYPNIAGVYILLRIMDLAQVNAKRVWIDAEALAAWTGLNPAEKYFALLEAWLLEADGTVLGGENRSQVDGFAHTLHFLAREVSSRWKTFDEWCHIYNFQGGVSTWNTQLMMRFGLIEVQPRPVKGRKSSTRGWLMMKAKRTPWGEAVAWAILERMIATAENESDVEFYRLPDKLDPGYFQPAFQPFFPEYQKVLSPPPPVSEPGSYVFKVTLDPRYHGCVGVWRRLAAPGDASLYDLATAILDAFKFKDDEHLYEFRFKDRSGKPRVYFHPFTDDGPYSDDITLEEAGLLEKQTIKFRFDYGDDWRFVLRLDRIDRPDKEQRGVELVGSAGNGPKQHAQWE